jgi:hypothetical protein
MSKKSKKHGIRNASHVTDSEGNTIAEACNVSDLQDGDHCLQVSFIGGHPSVAGYKAVTIKGRRYLETPISGGMGMCFPVDPEGDKGLRIERFCFKLNEPRMPKSGNLFFRSESLRGAPL